MILLFCVSGIGIQQKKAQAISSRGGYEILSYDCYYRVTENNVYHVIETIEVNFTEYRHGIYRKIPEVNHIQRRDGSTDTVVAQVDVKSCSDQYDDYREDDNRVIKIGNKNTEIIGRQTYTIQYDVNWGNDRVDGADEFYMNLIGNGWDVNVNNLSYTIEFPKEFKDTGDNIGFYYGAYNDTKVDGIRYSFDGKTIRGNLHGYYIEPGAYFTTRVVLEDGYFLQTSALPVSGIVALVLCCLFMAVSLILWLRIGRDKDIIDVVEFYPPDGLNCAEMAYSYYGKITNKDCVPMLIGLASKGYIEINQDDDSGKKFSFRLLKDYEGSDKSEMLFLNGLKKYGEIITKTELENSFYKTLNTVNKQVVDDMKPRIFYTKTLIWRYITLPLAIIPYLVGMYPAFRFFYGDFIMAVLFPLAMCVFISTFTVIISFKKTPLAMKIFLGVLMCLSIGVNMYLTADAINYYGTFYWVVYAGCVIANIIQMIFFRIIDKRTDYGIDLLGRIRGFRNYLITAERPHLVSLVHQDPKYFYKILPYTYVLNITDEWVNQFESIAMEPPDWYHSPYGSGFHYHSFHSFMNRTMTSAQAAMTSTPGGSSGGGFSGGGGGGGGGGSW
ncbi:MAG: DUF2207 domain-containing protein [Eubacterium sp.]|nr:DUF2207 domain-containing protein [Eubacterium sp.]